MSENEVGSEKYSTTLVPESEENELNYSIPDWFLVHRVRTPTNSDVEYTKINICDHCEQNNSGDGKRDDSPHDSYNIPTDTFSELRDIAAAAFVPNSIGEFPLDEACINVATSVARNMVVLSAVIEHLAKEFRATLIEISMEDLEDLASSFVLQHNRKTCNEPDSRMRDEDLSPSTSSPSIAEYYFAIDSKDAVTEKSWKRNQRALSAVLECSGLKIASANHATNNFENQIQSEKELPSYESRPVMIHLHSIEHTASLYTRERIIARLCEAVREKRKAGEPFLLVYTDSKTEDPIYYALYGGMMQSSSLSESSRISFEPLPSSKELIDSSYAIMVRGSNIRRLKRFLRSRVSHAFTEEVLEPFSDWSKMGFGHHFDYLGHSSWPDESIRRAAIQIAGRAWSRKSLGLEDVRLVLARLHLYTIPENSDNINSEESNNTDQSAIDAWEKKLESVRNDCNSFETELISSVVNPKQLDASYEQVIIDGELKDICKTLLGFSNFQPKAASNFLLQQIRIKGVLLYGPPGTGKTHLSRAIAKDSGASMLVVDSAAVQSKWVGETDKYIKAAFTLASKLFPCVLFIDEVDSLFYRRSPDDESWQRSALTQFLQQMDGLIKSDVAPFVLVATNRPLDLDDAFLRRLPQKIMLGLPDTDSRSRILQLFLTREDLDPLVDIESLAEQTLGYSGSDLRNLCAEAALLWLIEQPKTQVNGTPPGSDIHLRLSPSHFSKALKKIQPTVSLQMLNDIDNFARRFDPGSIQSPKDKRRDVFTSKTSSADPVTGRFAHKDQSCFLDKLVSIPSTLVPSLNDHSVPIELPTTTVAAIGSVSEITEFSYDQLESDQFRLLKIYPGNPGEPLQGELKHVFFDDPPSYHALSYTWGSPDPEFYFSCAGMEIRITKNLHDALCAARDALHPLIIWADALCINQSNDEEKSHQVTRMCEIYAKAKKLFIWMGEPDDPQEAAVAFQTLVLWEKLFLRHVSADSLRMPWLLGNPSAFKNAASNIWQELLGSRHWEVAVTGHTKNKQQLQSVGRFYSKPWFTRVWIIQEVVSFAGDDRSDIIIGYGNQKIPWDTCSIVSGGLEVFAGLVEQVMAPIGLEPRDFPHQVIHAIKMERKRGEITVNVADEDLSQAKIAGLLKKHSGDKLACIIRIEVDLRLAIYPGDYAGLIGKVFNAVDFSKKALRENNLPENFLHLHPLIDGIRATGGRHSRLHQLLDLSRSMHSTDPRDKIFAFYGMLESELGGDSGLKPDYGKDVVTVFTNLTLDFISKDWSLGIFEMQCYQPPEEMQTPGLPSWAVNFSQKPDGEMFVTEIYCSGGANLPGGLIHPAVAGLRVSPCRRFLQVFAVLVGAIELHVPAADDMTYDNVHNLDEKCMLSQRMKRLTRAAQLDLKEAKYRKDLFPQWIRYRDILLCTRTLEASFASYGDETDVWSAPSKKITYGSGQSLYEAFWRTLVCDIDRQGNRASSSLQDAFEAYHRGYDPRIPSNIRQAWMKSETKLEPFDRFSMEHRRYTNTRCFCVSDSGFIGWVPRCSRPGDAICVLAGARTPYIIRKAGDYWELIGHAYIHGLMEGMISEMELTISSRGMDILGPSATLSEIWLK